MHQEEDEMDWSAEEVTCIKSILEVGVHGYWKISCGGRAPDLLLFLLQLKGQPNIIPNIIVLSLLITSFSSWSRCLMMDLLTLKGLQIFQEDRHPSVMGIGGAKEGFSVFGMFNRCITTMVMKD